MTDETRKSKSVVNPKLLLAFLICASATLAQQAIRVAAFPDRGEDRAKGAAMSEGSVVEVVRGMGAQFWPEPLQRWSGKESAYKDIVWMLQTDPVGGWDWRNAVDALAVVAAANAGLAQAAFTDLKRYAVISSPFCCTSHGTCVGRQHEGASEAIGISDTAAYSKIEVPAAIGLLTQRSPYQEIKKQGIRFLLDSASPRYWSDTVNVKWTSTLFDTTFERNVALAMQSLEALSRICEPAAQLALTQAISALKEASADQRFLSSVRDHIKAFKSLPEQCRPDFSTLQ